MTDILGALDDPTRVNIVQNILGHAHGAPSLEEVEYYNPNTSNSEIRDHIGVLIDADVLTRVALPEEDRTLENPHEFYTLTEEAWERLNQHDILVDKLDEIRSDHERVEKTDRIEQYENAPRPDLPSVGP